MQNKLEKLGSLFLLVEIAVSIVINYSKGKQSILDDIIFGICLCAISCIFFATILKVIHKHLKKQMLKKVETIVLIFLFIVSIILEIEISIFPTGSSIMIDQFMIIGVYNGILFGKSNS